MAADGDLDLQLRQALMGRPIFCGLAPTMDEFNPLLRTPVRQSVALFKNMIRTIMIGYRVYHHTPITPVMGGTPWMVMENGTPDRRRSIA